MNLDELSEWVEHLRRWASRGFKVDDVYGVQRETVIHTTTKSRHICTLAHSWSPHTTYAQIAVWFSESEDSSDTYQLSPYYFRLDGEFEVKQLLNAYVMILERVDSFTHVHKLIFEGFQVIANEYDKQTEIHSLKEGEPSRSWIIQYLHTLGEALFAERWSDRVKIARLFFFKISPSDLLEYIKSNCFYELLVYDRRRRHE